jgi:hypothetical protein
MVAIRRGFLLLPAGQAFFSAPRRMGEASHHERSPADKAIHAVIAAYLFVMPLVDYNALTPKTYYVAPLPVHPSYEHMAQAVWLPLAVVLILAILPGSPISTCPIVSLRDFTMVLCAGKEECSSPLGLCASHTRLDSTFSLPLCPICFCADISERFLSTH